MSRPLPLVYDGRNFWWDPASRTWGTYMLQYFTEDVYVLGHYNVYMEQWYGDGTVDGGYRWVRTQRTFPRWVWVTIREYLDAN